MNACVWSEHKTEQIKRRRSGPQRGDPTESHMDTHILEARSNFPACIGVPASSLSLRALSILFCLQLLNITVFSPHDLTSYYFRQLVITCWTEFTLIISPHLWFCPSKQINVTTELPQLLSGNHINVSLWAFLINGAPKHYWWFVLRFHHLRTKTYSLDVPELAVTMNQDGHGFWAKSLYKHEWSVFFKS